MDKFSTCTSHVHDIVFDNLQFLSVNRGITQFYTFLIAAALCDITCLCFEREKLHFFCWIVCVSSLASSSSLARRQMCSLGAL